MEVERLTAVLEATGVASFAAQMQTADRATAGTREQIDKLTAVSQIAAEALDRVRLTVGQAAESRMSAEAIIQGVRGVSDEAREAARELDHVKLTQTQAAETRLAADVQAAALRKVGREAEQTTAKVEVMNRVATRPGYGVGPLGSGYGRLGVFGAAVGLGALTAPAAGPAAAGLLAAIPAFAAGATGALGTLVLAFQGVGKAIGGDYKAFQELNAQQQAFVQTVRSLDGWLDRLKDTASAGMLPGLTKGLHEALSPGTVATITQAVSGFATAIGQAGEQWGRYFGSPAFQQLLGPLMQSGARNLGVLSDAMLNLFDALGVLGRAAIPFTNWLNDMIDKGARFASAWMRAKDATGALSGAMSEAQQSLRLVGGLFTALLRAVGALGEALYPVSKTAVKDLTDGLNALAGIIDRNRQTIADIVGGALAALVAMVKAAVPVVGALAKAVQAVTDAIGGWKHAFELLLAVFTVAKVQAMITNIAMVGTAAGTTAAEVTGLRAALLALGGPEVLAAIAAATAALFAMSRSGGGVGSTPVGQPAGDQTAATGGEVTRGKNGQWYWHRLGRYFPITAAQAQVLLGQQTPGLTSEHGAGMGAPGTGSLPFSAANSALGGLGQVYAAGRNVDLTHENPALMEALSQLSAVTGLRLQVTSGYRSYARQKYLWDNAAKLGLIRGVTVAKPGTSEHQFGRAADVMAIVNGKAVPLTQAVSAAELAKVGLTGIGASDAVHVQLAAAAAAENVWQPPPPFTTNVPKPPKPPASSLIPAAASRQADVASRYANLAKQLSNTGATAKTYLDQELIALTKEWQILRGKAADATGKTKTQLDKAVTGIENKMRDVGKLISDAIVISGDQLLPASLRSKLAGLQAQYQADVDYAAALTGQAADDYRNVLKHDLTAQAGTLDHQVQILKGKLAAAAGKQKAAVQTELTKVQGQLDQVNQQILANLQQTVTSLQQQVSSLFSSVQQEMDTQLGNRYYQNGLLTPSEALLRQMQQQDQLNSLTQALQQAKDTLAQDRNTLAKRVLDVATGQVTNVYDPLNAQKLAQDQQAVQQAQRALDEYNLQLKAARERTDADQAYAQQVKSLNADLARWEEQVLNGTGSIEQLRQIADRYGIQISQQTIPDFADLSTAVGKLQKAFQALIDWIATKTGSRPTPIPTGSSASPGGGGIVASLPAAPGAALQAVHQAAVSGAIDSATAAYLARGLRVPLYEQGGPTGPGGLAMLHPDEYVVPRGGTLVKTGGGQQVEQHIHVYLNGREISAEVRKELIKVARRNGNTTSSLLGTS